MKIARIAALVLVPMLTLTAQASAAPQTITFKCKASALGQTAEFTLDQVIDATAPETVAPNGSVKVTADPAPDKMPAEASGYEVVEVKGLALKVPVPANSKFQSASLEGGSGLNSTPTIALEGNDVVLRVPGPIKGGADYELPTVTVVLQAGGTGQIVSKIGGTSFEQPGLTFVATIIAFGFRVDANATGYPDPSPVLTTTTISG